MLISSVSLSAILHGTLFTFGFQEAPLTAFHSGPQHSPYAMVLLPGLNEGPMALPWTTRIADAIAQRGWSTVQPTLSASFSGFGMSSLEYDTWELDMLMDHLVKLGKKHIMLVGHSTGNQQSLHYARFGKNRAPLVGCVLQAAMSDREWYVSAEPNHQKWIALARSMAAKNQSEEMMPRDAYSFGPVTVRRFLSLADKNGTDDMFSSDLTLEQRKAIYAPVQVKLAMILSGNDEYRPMTVQSELLLENARTAYPRFTVLKTIPGVDHAVTPVGGQIELVNTILSFMDTLDIPK
ncbi:hypothetical protein SYNPS1DRAFT_18061 [Syncephalis pseudoplumigaleata]|uniref:Alpha/Beta hydrolase protein n=1 Tax=Syncephalis pseudoplumigaleata TaxID=1712513 RepID=A0A4P9YWF7_9FUNG|nr:hypothetical protein SYNPS1DRAFT_18061 [Syncephalis pseudoplumigaleata]|eukprot:RKP23812.1 hypothetical protein SYNPS1DRAFT_18061 [Syncephalis pseudoplumigaleata]